MNENIKPIVNPIAVCEVAEVLERCLSLNESLIVNVAGPERLTLREIGEYIGFVLGVPPKFTVRPEQSAPVLVGDTSLMKEQLRWSPQVTFESGLRMWLDSPA